MGRHRKLHTYDGRTQTLEQWSNELGVSKRTLEARILAGMPTERVFSSGRLSSPHPPDSASIKRLTHDGRTQSMSAWAEELGISLAALSRRISRGWPADRIFARGRQAGERAGAGGPRRLVTRDGRTQSIRAWAEEIGIPYKTLAGRLRCDKSAADPFSPVVKAHYRMLTHDGRTQSMSAWAREAGIPPHKLLQRLSRGWPMARALLPGDRRRDVRGGLTHAGRTQSMRAWALEAGISPSTLCRRLARGLPMAVALLPAAGRKGAGDAQD